MFTTLNLRSGYYHIKLGKGSHAKTAFVTPFGKFVLYMVPFGLAQSPAYLQALINKVLKGLHKFTVGTAKEASSTRMHSPKKPMQSTFPSESSASILPVVIYSSGVTTYH